MMLKGTLWGVEYTYEENTGLWQAWVLGQQVGGIAHCYMMDEVSKTIMIEALKTKGFIKNGGNGDRMGAHNRSREWQTGPPRHRYDGYIRRFVVVFLALCRRPE